MSKLLNFLTPTVIMILGLAGATASTWLLLGGATAITLTALLVASSTLFFGKEVELLQRRIGHFARVPAWPRFVLLAIALLVATVSGGWRAGVVSVFILVAIVGDTFDSLY